MMEKIVNCKKCDEEAFLFKSTAIYFPSRWFVACPKCDLKQISGDKNTAIALWNMQNGLALEDEKDSAE